MKNTKLLFLLATISAATCGCMVGPNFEKPKTDVPEQWEAGDGEPLAEQFERKTSDAELAQWWNIFKDEELTSLIDRAFKGNLSLQATAEKIAQARATLGITQSGFFPALDLNAGVREYGKPIDSSHTSYSMGATAAWEVDVFGGIRRGIESTAAEYRAAMADKVAAKIALAAEVAQNYFNYRSLQRELEITKNNLETQKGTYRVTKMRRENGMVSTLDVVRAAAQVEITTSQIPALENELTLSRHALELLLGVQTGSLKTELEKTASLPYLERYIPISVPAKLLERRPDIIAAEYKMHAAVAKIGHARADYYPKFSITGNIAYDAPSIGSLTENRHGSWSVGPSVSWNIFQAGKTVYNVELQESLARSAGIAWKEKVLTAIKEVEDSLVSAEKEREKFETINRIVENQKKAFELSRKLYAEGETEFIDLLETQRAMLDSQQTQIRSRKNFALYIVSLYKALGGGWTPEDMKDNPEKLEYLFFTDLAETKEKPQAKE